MSFDDEICPDYHACRNGGMCVESRIREGSFFCDCERMDEYVNTFAGVSCEHESTVFCNEYNEKSYTSFCTNGGACKILVGVEEQHQGCSCIYPYTGDFCEFLVGQKVPAHIGNEIGFPSSNEGSSGKSATVAIAILVLIFVFGLVGALITYFWLTKHKRNGKYVFYPDNGAQTRSSASALPQLEADGAVLQKAVQEKEAGVVAQDEEEDPALEDPAFATNPFNDNVPPFVASDPTNNNEKGVDETTETEDLSDSVDEGSTSHGGQLI